MSMEYELSVCWKCRRDTYNDVGSYYQRVINNRLIWVFICDKCIKKEKSDNTRYKNLLKKYGVE